MQSISSPQHRGFTNLLGFIACTGMMGVALYQQYFEGQEPCHLCILQRAAVSLMGLVFLIASLDGFTHRLIWARSLRSVNDKAQVASLHIARRWHVCRSTLYTSLLELIGVSGCICAGRQVWLQSQPEGSVPSCGAPLELLVKMFGIPKALYKTFMGGADCQQVTWTFLGLHTPAWVLICLVLLTFWAVSANANWPAKLVVKHT